MSASACWRTIADPETSCSLGGSTKTTVTIATSCGADPDDLGAVDVDALGGRSRAGAARRRVAVATSRWRAVDGDRSFGEADGLVVAPGQGDPHQRPEPADLGGAVHEHRPEPLVDLVRALGVAVAVGGAAELDDRDDPAVELDAEAGQGHRLDVPHDLLRVLGGVGEDVDLGRAAARSTTTRAAEISGSRQSSRSSSRTSSSAPSAVASWLVGPLIFHGRSL